MVYEIVAVEPYWVETRLHLENGKIEHRNPEIDGKLHDFRSSYRIVVRPEDKEICVLDDLDMAEDLLKDLEQSRISEEEARKIAQSGLKAYLYNVKALLSRS